MSIANFSRRLALVLATVATAACSKEGNRSAQLERSLS